MSVEKRGPIGAGGNTIAERRQASPQKRRATGLKQLYLAEYYGKLYFWELALKKLWGC
jgi:hypothetical protein